MTPYDVIMPHWVNTLRPRQNGRHFPDDIFKCIFLNENVWISMKISLKFVPKVPINDIPALVQIMAWRRPGDKPLSEQMMVSLFSHICVTGPQWVNTTPVYPLWILDPLLALARGWHRYLFTTVHHCHYRGLLSADRPIVCAIQWKLCRCNVGVKWAPLSTPFIQFGHVY